MTTPLDPRTLRWLAREAHKSLVAFPMYQHEQGFNDAMEYVKFKCRARARAIEERRAKKAGKRL